MSRVKIYPVDKRHFAQIEKCGDADFLAQSIDWNNEVLTKMTGHVEALNAACRERIAVLNGAKVEYEVALVRKFRQVEQFKGSRSRVSYAVRVTKAFPELDTSEELLYAIYHSDPHSRKVAREHAEALAAKYNTKVVKRSQ